MFPYTANCALSTLKLYGAADKRNQLESLLSWVPARCRASVPPAQGPSVRPYDAPTSHATQGYPSHHPLSSSASSATQTSDALRRQQEEFARAAELRQTLANLEKVDDESRRSSLLDTLCSTEDIMDLPEHPNPPGIASGELRVDLLRHQVCGRFLHVGHQLNPASASIETSTTVGH